MPDLRNESPPAADRRAARRLALQSAMTRPADERPDLLASRAERYRRKSAATVGDHVEFVVFQRSGARYAMDIRQLLEIRPLTRLATVPGASPAIKGIVLVRGHVVAVHDIASLSQDMPMGPQSFVLVGSGEAAAVALLADEIEGVAQVELADIHRPPINLGLPDDCFTGVTRDGALILHLGGLIKQPAFLSA